MTRRPVLAAAAIALSTLAAAVGVAPVPAGAGGDTIELFTEVDPGAVDGTYVPVAGNFSDVDFYDDVLWYAPGRGAESLWVDDGGVFAKRNLGNRVTGTFRPVVGDFAGDQLDDIFWYAPGSAPDYLWVASGDAAFTSIPVPVKGTYEPTVLHDDVGKDDIVWVKPSGGATSVWSFTGQGAQHAVHPVSTIPGARPLVGDFDGNGFDDAFWYGPGSIPDAAWYGAGDGTFAVQSASVTGAYQPVVAQLTQSNGTQPRCDDQSNEVPGPDQCEDILWYRASGPTKVWYGRGNRIFVSETTGSFGGSAGTPFAGVDGFVFLWSPAQKDKVFLDGTAWDSANSEVPGGYQPIVGNWAGVPGILFYRRGPAPEIWFQ